MHWRGKKLSNLEIQKQFEENKINSIRNPFILKKEKIEKEIKDRIIKDIRTHFEQEYDDYYKPKSVGNFWNNSYIEYESNGDRNKTYHPMNS